MIFSQYKHGNELLDALYQAETPVALGVLMDKLQSVAAEHHVYHGKCQQGVDGKAVPADWQHQGDGVFSVSSSQESTAGGANGNPARSGPVSAFGGRLDSRTMSPEEDRLLLNYIIITQDTTLSAVLWRFFRLLHSQILNRLRSLQEYNQDNAFRIVVTAKGRVAK